MRIPVVAVVAACLVTAVPPASVLAQVPRLTPVGSIGCATCAGPHAFDRIQALSIAPDGRILVADRSEPMVRLFHADGTVMLAHGGMGEGPGEHRLLVHVAGLPDGGHETLDMRLRRLTEFDASGGVRRTHDTGLFLEGGGRTGGGPLVLQSIDFATFSSTLHRWDAAGDSTIPLLEVRPPSAEASDHALLHSAVGADGRMAWGWGEYSYTIHRRGADGAALPDLHRDLPRPRRSPAELERARADRQASMARMAEMARAEGGGAPRVEVPAEENHFIDLAYDPEGRLWVLTNRGDLERSMVDVFAPGGAFLGEVTLPGRVTRLALGAGLLAGVAADEHGADRVLLWRVGG